MRLYFVVYIISLLYNLNEKLVSSFIIGIDLGSEFIKV